MNRALRLVTAAAPRLAVDPSRRGYHVAYRGAETPCPGCARSNWDVRRTTATCAFCETAIPLVEGSR